MNTVVIGASGVVGTYLVKRFEAARFDVIGTYYRTKTSDAAVQLDKTDEQAVSRVVSSHDADLIIDAGAFHDVDQCEIRRDRAWTVNVTGTRNVATVADRADAHYVFFSTDYVFPGDSDRAPYAESDPVDPVNFYGQTKYAGEQAATIATRSTVLRSSVLYGATRSNFMTWALDQLKEKKELAVVNDQVNSPTYAADIAEACLEIGQRNLTGLFHAGGPESLSRYEFVRRLAETVWDDGVEVRPIPSEELGQRAARPSDSSLDSSRLYDAIDYSFRDCVTAFNEVFS
jgi:dTDP-4-dehydrorhamnose reductase